MKDKTCGPGSSNPFFLNITGIWDNEYEEIAGLTFKKMTMLTVVGNMQCRSKVEIVMKATRHIATQKHR